MIDPFKTLEREISDLVDKKFSKIKGVKPFSGLIVGDSSPLSKDSLCLAQKIDLLLNGGENSLNIYKESIGPFTNIHFKLSLDRTKIGEVDIEYIKNALEFYKNQMSDYFFKEFGVEKVIYGHLHGEYLGKIYGFKAALDNLPIAELDNRLRENPNYFYES